MYIGDVQRDLHAQHVSLQLSSSRAGGSSSASAWWSCLGLIIAAFDERSMGRRRLRDLLSLRSRLSLADFEAPDDLLCSGRGSASSRTNGGLVQRNIYRSPSAACCLVLTLKCFCPRHQPTHQGEPCAWNLLPGAPARPTTSSADPSSAPRHSHSHSNQQPPWKRIK